MNQLEVEVNTTVHPSARHAMQALPDQVNGDAAGPKPRIKRDADRDSRLNMHVLESPD